ncbi:hypothetical protein FA95DRAFT_1482661 [Auriscalpium vulgare]|uniref:Uncharacterized protein n=1 Tax=Auriscalpium vulgare TaxID=40419 RepID=A0ACB8S8E0_9AGAM|nr:hypothetical protein FA95DRAFT_1482661 [Auriscalpium vulgare]
MPSFITSSTPLLAPGGGAEVLPLGMMNSGDASWLEYNGFSTKDADQTCATRLPHFRGCSLLTLYGASSLHANKWFAPPDPPPQDYLPRGEETPLSSNFIPAANQTHRLHPANHHRGVASALSNTPSGLPVYSSSGFDLLTILARVATRPHPTINLGPVDMSCSFVVVDVRRYDSPIVYASPEFYRLTGYSEREVLGRNCRFLQAPGGRVARSERRTYTAPESVSCLKKSLDAGKECQTSLVNYKKDGSAFINLVTVIPVPGGTGSPDDKNEEVVFHVGFQVDLTEQPNAILQKLRDGSYMVNYGATINMTPSAQVVTFGSRERKNYTLNSVSGDLRTMLDNPAFSRLALEDKKDTATDKGEWYEGNHTLSLLLLHLSPDPVIVLSLKGSFLYVAPSIFDMLGHSPSSLVGKSIIDFCHPADTVPLMRELKESSSMAPYDGSSPYVPRIVNLLFRARNSDEEYNWIECIGRLHVEPGKGRKAIILSARPRPMPSLAWKWVPTASTDSTDPLEVWGLLSAGGSVLFVDQGIIKMLGWAVGEAIGMSVRDFVKDPADQAALDELLRRVGRRQTHAPKRVAFRATQKDGGAIGLVITVYPLPADGGDRPLVCQFVEAPSVDAMPLSRRLPRGEDGPGGEGDMFDALNVARESSWQYELQQLKIGNTRLEQELESLEAVLNARGGSAAAVKAETEVKSAPGGRSAIVNEYLQSLADPSWMLAFPQPIAMPVAHAGVSGMNMASVAAAAEAYMTTDSGATKRRWGAP